MSRMQRVDPLRLQTPGPMQIRPGQAVVPKMYGTLLPGFHAGENQTSHAVFGAANAIPCPVDCPPASDRFIK